MITLAAFLADTSAMSAPAMAGGRGARPVHQYSTEPGIIQVQLQQASDHEKRALDVLTADGDLGHALKLIRTGYVYIRYAMGGVDLRRQMRFASPLLGIQKKTIDGAMDDIRLAEIEVEAGRTEPARLATAVALLQRAIVRIEDALSLNN